MKNLICVICVVIMFLGLSFVASNNAASHSCQENTLSVCPTCQGSGTGNFACFFCKGTELNGNFKCHFCNGKGFQKCSACGGTGQKK